MQTSWFTQQTHTTVPPCPENTPQLHTHNQYHAHKATVWLQKTWNMIYELHETFSRYQQSSFWVLYKKIQVWYNMRARKWSHDHFNACKVSWNFTKWRKRGKIAGDTLMHCCCSLYEPHLPVKSSHCVTLNCKSHHVQRHAFWLRHKQGNTLAF